MISIDACLVVAAYLLAYLLRFEGQIPQQEWKSFSTTILYILPFKGAYFIVSLREWEKNRHL